MARMGTRLKHAWNAFNNRSQDMRSYGEYGVSYGGRPDRVRYRVTNERSIISSIYNRVSIDVAAIDIRHVRRDEQNRYLEDIDSGLNNCLTLEANQDQGARAFRQDVVATLFDQGVAAIVPVDTSINPDSSGGFDIRTLRCGTITAWYPKHVRVSLYNEDKHMREEITLAKKYVAIVENPLYSVMNEPNSTLQRLIRKLGLLDMTDDASAANKLDLIIQLPYVVKSEARREQALQRTKDIEFQLRQNEYGIAYTDGTEKITQLNRPAENNLMGQIEFLTQMLYGQLGITEAVMNGTADEVAMLNYYNRTLEPIMTAISEAMCRTFLTKTARSQKQWIMFFRDPFKLIQLADMAEIADKFTRNEILSSNEVRSYMGIPPSTDPKADQLVNSNMPQADAGGGGDTQVMAQSFDEIDKAIDDAFSELGVSNAVA